MRPSRIILKTGSAAATADSNAFTLTISGASTKGMYVRTGGAWTKYTPNVRVSGNWYEPDAYVRVGGAWVQVYTKRPTLDPNNKATIMVLSENNLRCLSNSTAARGAAFGTFGMTTGKWYWEVLSLSAVTAQGVGIGAAGANINEYLGSDAFSWGYFPSGAYWTAGVNQGTGTAWGTNSIIGLALDVAGNLDVYVDDRESFSIAHGLAGPIWAGISDSSTGGVSNFVMNFGQDSSFNGRVAAQDNPDENGNGDFYYVPPAGYKMMGT